MDDDGDSVGGDDDDGDDDDGDDDDGDDDSDDDDGGWFGEDDERQAVGVEAWRRSRGRP